jgi:hypothetical protein
MSIMDYCEGQFWRGLLCRAVIREAFDLEHWASVAELIRCALGLVH